MRTNMLPRTVGRHAAELAVPLVKHMKPGDMLDVAFLADVAHDFPSLFTDRYRKQFGSR